MRTNLKRQRFCRKLLRQKKIPAAVGGAVLLVICLILFGERRPEEIPLSEEAVSLPAVLPVREAALPAEYYLLEEPAAEEQPEIIPLPEIPEENKAALVYQTFAASSSGIYLPLENGFLKNCTSLSNKTLQQAIEKGPAFSVAANRQAEVLIMHTHATESYLPFPEGSYDITYATRSTDSSKNMVAVGEVVAEKLRQAGIGVLHDTTLHDYPSYNGSYDRSRETVEGYLSEYPSVKIVLDLHRDAILSGDTAVAPVAEINGQTAAQLMIISGCDDGTMDFPDYLENLAFAAELQNALEKAYPGLTRPILFDYRKYNQDLTSGSLLIEMGSHGNTLEQALFSAELLGEVLGKLLTGS